MKKIITLTLLSVFGWAGTTFGQCTADATVALTGNPGEVVITDQSTTGSTTIYSDIQFTKQPSNTYAGTVQLQPNTTTASFQFTSNGTYDYFVQVFDSLASCMDTLNGSITITGITTPANCDASFSFISNVANQNQYFFTANTNNLGLFYYWNFGDGNTSNSTNPSHTFSTAGTYDVCLTVEDTVASCIDTICQTITVGTPPVSCDANFAFIQDSTNSSQIYAWNLSNGTNLSYSWDFGDGGTSNQQYPTYNYQNIGTYTICLTVSDVSGCNDTYCDSIVITTKTDGTTLSILNPFQGTSTIDEENKTNVQDVTLFPNPNNGSFSLVLNTKSASPIDLQLTSLTGAIVMQKNVNANSGENRLDFDQSNLSNGIYLLNVRDVNSGDQQVIKIIKN